MEKNDSDYLTDLKRKFLRIKPIAWLALIVILLAGVATALQNLQTIINIFKSDKPSISIVSYGLAADESIFAEKIIHDMPYFYVPDEQRHIMIDLHLSNETARVPSRALSAMNSAIDFLFTAQRNSSFPISSNNLKEIFMNEDKQMLLKLIAPINPKVPQYEEYNEDRLELFSLVDKILTKELFEKGDGFLREYVRPYRPLLMGRFQPVINFTLHNTGKRVAIIGGVDIEVKSVKPMEAEVPTGLVPVFEIVDVTLPSRQGKSSTKLANPIQVAPDASIIIPIRFNAESHGLQSYELKVVINGPEVEASTGYFSLEM